MALTREWEGLPAGSTNWASSQPNWFEYPVYRWAPPPHWHSWHLLGYLFARLIGSALQTRPASRPVSASVQPRAFGCVAPSSPFSSGEDRLRRPPRPRLLHR